MELILRKFWSQSSPPFVRTAAIGRIAAEKLIDLIENPKTTLIDRFSVDGALFKGASVKKIKK